MQNGIDTYKRQSFGNTLAPKAPVGLLTVDFVNSFANHERFGGGNIAQAIERTVLLLAHARERKWPVAHTRIVFADDAADRNIFTEKVPGMLTLKERDRGRTRAARRRTGRAQDRAVRILRHLACRVVRRAWWRAR